MARFGGLTERRHLRRAAEQALVEYHYTSPVATLEREVDDAGSAPHETPAGHRSHRATYVAIGAVGVAIAVVAVLLLMSRADPDTGQPANESPRTSPAPTPADVTPAPSITPMPPPPPPPPETPPPPARVIVPPNPQPVQTAPTHEDMPEIGVTRTPATRRPFSASPPPPPPPLYNPSDGNQGPNRGGCCGF